MDEAEVAGADWRPVVAALANRDARGVWAALVATGGADAGLSASRTRRALELLERVGLVRGVGDSFEADDAVFRALLAASTANRPKPTGVDRFLRPDGRIDRYPSSADDRMALLRMIAESVLAGGEVIGERELTERLAHRSDDPVALRRYLVDAGLVVRTRSGSEYARA
ncbi:DUF2087 domain-containing protein [Leifsonia sp. NPDC077715]|uniref:DUF2087 domain-containing protein n=1 Tax=Leifsonia sp. NPDC077715 TaxID=3155539 RepID=UPI0034157E23